MTDNTKKLKNICIDVHYDENGNFKNMVIEDNIFTSTDEAIAYLSRLYDKIPDATSKKNEAKR